MSYFSKAVIVWIDDHFLTQTFIKDKQKKSWHKLFGKINSNLYRLLNIEIKYIKTAKEAAEYIKTENRFQSNIYYYFIVDRKLPYDENDDSVDSNSEGIIKYLQHYQKKYNCLDLSVLSSGSPESYAIKNIDYHLKPRNKEFSLPDALRHKILLNIKENIVFIDQYDFICSIKINQFSTSNIDFEKQSSFLFPFIGKYKSFVELEEIGKKDFSTLIVSAPSSVSDKFILQSTLISLYEHLKDYNGLNYYVEQSYDKLKVSGNFEGINELTDQIAIIRLKSWDVESYKNLNTHLKYKHIKVFVVDSEDDNLSNYIDNTTNVKIVKVDTIKDNIEISKNILFALLEKYINSLFDISDTIYNQYHILFIHPLIYMMVSSSKIHLKNFDDPSEMIDEIQEYFHSLGLEHSGDYDYNKQAILASSPIENFSSVYTQVEKLCNNNNLYNKLLFETVKYWLDNSWNVGYNIDIRNYSIEIQGKWQKKSFEILAELVEKIDFKGIEDEDLQDTKQIKETIEYFHKNFNKNNISSSKILWPHGKYPMSTYIQNELLQSSNKKLYVQDKDLSFIDDSVELENGFKSLEYKIEYYRSIFDLIDKTEIYFPSDISSFIKSIKDRIQNNEPIFLEVNSKNDDKENFEKLANILLRIVINFGTLIININEDSLSYNRRVSQPLSEDKAGLGTLLSDLRDHIYNKKSNIFNCHGFQLKCDSYINSTEHHTFLVEYTKLLNNNTKNILQFKTANQSSLFKLDSNNLKSVHIPVIISKNFDYKFTYFDKKKKKDIIQSISYKKDQHVTEKEILDVNEIIKLAKEQGKIDDKIKAIEYSYEDVNLSYFNKLFVANNISKISQISNISSYLMQNEHLLKIEKHIGAYSFLAYLADTRNTWAHGDKQAWNRELFVEAFIYGFESIWLMQKFILENMYEQNNLPETKYVKLNDLEISDNRKKEFLSNFESLEKYQSYFNGLYKKVTNKND